MKKIVQLNVRITLLLDDKISEKCNDLNLTRSTFVYKAIMFLIGKTRKSKNGIDHDESEQLRILEEGDLLKVYSRATAYYDNHLEKMIQNDYQSEVAAQEPSLRRDSYSNR